MEKIAAGTIVADSIISADLPVLVRLRTLEPFEFNLRVPKSTVVGAEDRVAFAGCDDGVLNPAHAVKSNVRANVNKTGMTKRRDESCFSNLYSGEDFISVSEAFEIVGQA